MTVRRQIAAAVLTRLSVSVAADAARTDWQRREASFRGVPAEARPHVWWHWVDGCIFFVGTRHGFMRGPVDFFSDEWFSLFRHAVAGAYFTIKREWRLGDIVELKFDMPVVAHLLERNVAFTRGPVLLARDSRLGNGDLMEPFRSGLEDGQTMLGISSVRTPSDDFWMAFSAALPIGSHHENPEGANPETVFFCDYASAGNTWRRDNYYRTWFPVEIPPESR